jgi:hypothetical protein
MIQQMQKLLLETQFEKLEKIIISKGGDYATKTDVLKNFKGTAQALNIEPERVILMFIQTKILRIVNLMDKSGRPNHESIFDSITDLQAYSLILEHMLTETLDKNSNFDL